MTNKPVIDQSAWTVALLLSGVTAGMFLMDCLGYYPLLPRLADHVAIQLHQESVALHRELFRLATLSSGVACLVMIVFFSESTSRGLMIASLACLIDHIAPDRKCRSGPIPILSVIVLRTARTTR